MNKFLLLLLFPCVAFATEIDNSKWQEFVETTKMECPNFIYFTDNKFEVLNDCYGSDIRKPIIETGSYLINNNKITFSNPVCQHYELGLTNKCITTVGIITKRVIVIKNDGKVFKYREIK